MPFIVNETMGSIQFFYTSIIQVSNDSIKKCIKMYKSLMSSIDVMLNCNAVMIFNSFL